MPMRCNTCGGEYAAVLPDGTRYFHACPPLLRKRVRRVDNSVAVLDLVDVLPSDVVLGDVVADRPNARDENVTRPDPLKPAIPKADGLGVTPLS